MNFPFEIIRVPGPEALKKLKELQGSEGLHPVIMGNSESFDYYQETFEDNDDCSLAECLDAARKINPTAWFARQMEEDPECYEIKPGEWPEDEEEPDNFLSAHCNIRTGEPYEEVLIVLVPAPESWMVPCYLQIGGWNSCPAAEEHAALFRYWGEKYDAQVACITHDVIEFQVGKPPQNRHEALELAKEQYIYCTDIVDQGVGSIEMLAATLVNASVWYFWWD